ncbi:MAG: FkbM family methyltransferase [Janthinobacterium lividum]
MKNKSLLFWRCKLGYLRNGQNLKDLKIIDDGRFYIYQVGGLYIASEAFNWYLTRDILAKEVKRISCQYYTPKLGETLIDVGAGLGEEMCIYTDMVGPKGRVYSIEANPVVYNVLQEVVKLNKFANVVPLNLAVSDAPGKVMIDDAPNSYLSSSLQNQTKGKVYEVDGMPFEDFCRANDLLKINLLKVNIEGAERFFSSCFACPDITIENVAIACHDFRFEAEGNEFFRTKQLVTDYLQANGYQTWSQNTGTRYIDDWVYGKKA